MVVQYFPVVNKLYRPDVNDRTDPDAAFLMAFYRVSSPGATFTVADFIVATSTMTKRYTRLDILRLVI